MAKILVVDDDAVLCLNVAEFFKGSGHKCDLTHDAEEASQMIERFQYDIVLMDWELPDGSGVQTIKKFRANNGITPILMLTGRSAIEDKEQGLDAGADDYLTKPFHMKELAARVRALLRRPPMTPGDELQVGDLLMKPEQRQVFLQGEEVKLRNIEFSVLEFFMRNPGKVFKPERIIERVWESTTDVSVHAVYSCIKRLKQALDKEGKESIFRNIPGQGYELVEK